MAMAMAMATAAMAALRLGMISSPGPPGCRPTREFELKFVGLFFLVQTFDLKHAHHGGQDREEQGPSSSKGRRCGPLPADCVDR